MSWYDLAIQVFVALSCENAYNRVNMEGEK